MQSPCSHFGLFGSPKASRHFSKRFFYCSKRFFSHRQIVLYGRRVHSGFCVVFTTSITCFHKSQARLIRSLSHTPRTNPINCNTRCQPIPLNMPNLAVLDAVSNSLPTTHSQPLIVPAAAAGVKFVERYSINISHSSFAVSLHYHSYHSPIFKYSYHSQ